jgi:hypothetical protein
MPPVPPFGGGGGGGTPPPYIPPDPAFAGVPEPILRAGIAAESSGDPTRLDALADSVGGQYPAYANLLRQKAAGMRSAAKAVAAAQGRLLKIRPGDLASTWAAWYTGNGLRWPELLPLNGLSKKTANGMTFPDPWNVGQTVEIPQAWNWAKGPPPAPSNVARAKKPAPPPPPAQEPNAPSGARTASLPSITGPLPAPSPNAIDAARRAVRK